METTNTVEVVLSREITPLIEQVRAKLPIAEMARVEMIVTHPDYTIQNAEGESVVNGYMRDTSTWADTVAKEWGPIKSFWHSVHAAACEAERETAPAIKTIRTACERALKAWMKRKAELAREAQARLDAATAAEKQRQEREARALALAGNIDAAETLMKSTATLRAPVVMEQPMKLAGTTVKPTWVATVTDPMALLRAIVDGKIPLNQDYRGGQRPLVTVDNSVLQAVAAKMGKQLNWLGVTVEEDVSFAARKR